MVDTKPNSRYNKYGLLIAAILIVIIVAYFIWIYGDALKGSEVLSNYTGHAISENFNNTLNYLQFHYNQTLGGSPNKTVNMTTLYAISENLPIPDYYSVINILLVIATAILALWAIIALEIYKTYKPFNYKKNITKDQKTWSKRSTIILLAMPVLPLVMSILLLLNGLFVYSFVQTQISYLISTLHVHTSINYIVTPLESEVQEVTQLVSFGTLYLAGGIIFRVIVLFLLLYLELITNKKIIKLLDTSRHR